MATRVLERKPKLIIKKGELEKTVKTGLINLQNMKWQMARQLDEPGFLQIELLAEHPAKKQEKIKILRKAMKWIVLQTTKQEKIIKNYGVKGISRFLVNEKIVCKEIHDENNLTSIVEKIDELNQKIQQTMAQIRAMQT